MAEAITPAAASGVRAFVMPSLGADMETGTILVWRIAAGDRVKRGDIVAEVETEKAEMEVEIFDEGVVERILVPVGEKVAVGTPLALISPEKAPAAAAASAAAVTPRPAPTPVPAAAPAQAPPSVPPAPPRREPPSGTRERRHATPLARRLAASLGVSLESVRGSGPGGAVTADDVRAALQGAPSITPLARDRAAEPARAPSPPAGRDASRQRVIAALMERSKREIPHYYLSAALDFTPALTWLEMHNRERPLAERVLPAVLLLRAVAIAAREVPEINGHYGDGGFRPSPALHLGVAIALRGGGLLAPAILDAGAKSLGELMRALRDLGERARSGRLRASEMSSATLTVTSLGERGVDSVQAVIYPPQVAIVGFGAPALRPWVDREGGLCARTVVHATLAADHRVSNGHRGALFLAAVGRALLEPERLA